MRYNEYNQPIGDAVENFTPGSWPNITTLEGDLVRVEKLNEKHTRDLYEFYGPSSKPESFTYLFVEKPFPDYESFQKEIYERMESKDFYHLTIIDKASGKAVGTFALMRINPTHRIIEMGNVLYSSQFKRSRQATEAQFLVMQYVFETLNYRRYEWKCDSLNAASRRAALRLGFTFEGIFRNAIVYKGRSRDTAWFSILDSEWEEKKKRLQTWLSPDNFDENGYQKKSLNDM
ncbi:hypothetical protein PIROE2DRAFT_41575 [Piromyces sp. E2]|nr:hypothetical protein PIROE2DRAFT_41575 [Piromyces sp. E2]|eukprot:OUM65508.1 hypothetical protein PIROE2DRAFT_41575 [Piromyces sp. E2]